MARLKDKAAQLFGRGRYDKAVIAYREVVAADPRDMGSRLRLGDAYRRLDKTGAALACYREVADFYARDGMLLKAIAACKLVLEVAPEHGDTQSLLANLYAQRMGKSVDDEAPASPQPLPEEQTPEQDAGEFVVEQTGAPGWRGEAQVEALDPPVEPEAFVVEQTSTPVAAAGGSDEAQLAVELPSDEDDEPVFEEEGDDDDPFIVHLDGDDEGVEIDLDSIDDEFIDVGRLEPPPPPPAPEERPLPTIPLFSDLDHDAFIEIMERMAYRELEPGEEVIREGEKGNSFYVIVSGVLRVTRLVEGEALGLARLGEGHFFGEMALLSEKPRAATVAAETEAAIFELDRALLDDLRDRYPSVKDALERFYRQRLLGNLFATSPIFRPFDKQERRKLMERFVALEVGPGEVVIKEGIPSDGLYLVLSGEFVVLRGKGFEEITLGRLHESEVFGEMSLLNRDAATATVKALRRSVLLRLPRQSFADLMMSHPQILEAVSRLSSKREEQTTAILERLASVTMGMDLDDDALVML